MNKVLLHGLLLLNCAISYCMSEASYVEQDPAGRRPVQELHYPNLLQGHSLTSNLVHGAIDLIDLHEYRLARVRYSVAPLPVVIGFFSFLVGTITAAKLIGTWKSGICCGLVCCGLGILLGKYLRWRKLRTCINNFVAQADNYARDWARQEPTPQPIRFNNQNYGLLQAIEEVPSTVRMRESIPNELREIIEKTDRIRIQRNPQAIIPPQILPNPIFNFNAEQLALVHQASELARQLTGHLNDHDAQLQRQIAHLSDDYCRDHPAVIITVDGARYNFREVIKLFRGAAARELGMLYPCTIHYIEGLGLLFPDAIERPAPPNGPLLV